jgi:simple sugar transport system permease protein
MNSFTAMLTDILKYTVAAATPLFFASTGGLFSELTGMLNIALEGFMGLGAFFGMAVAGLSGNVFLGAVAAVAAGILGAMLMGVVTLKLKANLFIAGLAINVLSGGITAVLSQSWYHTKAVVPFSIPSQASVFPRILSEIPLLGSILFSQSALSVCAWLWVILSAFVLRSTRRGMRMKATGMNPKAVSALGYSPDRLRMEALIWSGIGGGLGGYALGVSIAAFVPNIVSGRGWIALVAIYLGHRNPIWIALSCLLFALAESLSNYIQGFSSIPPLLVLALPYAVTLISLIAAGKKNVA